jgi:PadR family transcriptional regulator PadR
MLQDFFHGFIRIHILCLAEQGPVYGSEVAAELRRHGYESISPGTLYPALHGLEQAGYLVVQHRQDGGHWRKFYAITASGRETLRQIRVKLGELADEVLVRKEDIDTEHEYEHGRSTDSAVEKPASQRVGNQPDQLLHGPVERNGHQPAAPVPFERAGRKDERYWID